MPGIHSDISTAFGNTPLVWSHMEAARALYALHEARIRRLALQLWRTWRRALVALSPS